MPKSLLMIDTHTHTRETDNMHHETPKTQRLRCECGVWAELGESHCAECDDADMIDACEDLWEACGNDDDTNTEGSTT